MIELNEQFSARLDKDSSFLYHTRCDLNGLIIRKKCMNCRAEPPDETITLFKLYCIDKQLKFYEAQFALLSAQ